MSEKNLNIKYIQDKTGLVDNDELIPIILEMIQESYRAGLCQSEFDNTMGLIEENQELKKKLEQYQLEVCILDMRTDENIKYKNQQQEFIKYMRELSNWYSADGVKQGLVNGILQKYKEIIGDDK